MLIRFHKRHLMDEAEKTVGNKTFRIAFQRRPTALCWHTDVTKNNSDQNSKLEIRDQLDFYSTIYCCHIGTLYNIFFFLDIFTYKFKFTYLQAYGIICTIYNFIVNKQYFSMTFSKHLYGDVSTSLSFQNCCQFF